MLTCNEAFYELKSKLQPLYDEREAAAIAHDLLYHITGMDKIKRLIEKDTCLSETQQREYERSLEALLQGAPIQYVTGEAWFMGRMFQVNKHVLIPRPETEELVQWMIDDHKNKSGHIQILDVGTGSGCIPISLKSALPEIEITSVDISSDALDVAKENAKRAGTSIQFLKLDILDTREHNKLGVFDVIVSNPPYIPQSDKHAMHTNVKDQEPAIALFVPDHDPLLFYKAIAALGKGHLNQNGYIYCELDANHGAVCKALFEQAGYDNVALRKDMHGNWRMIRASFSQETD